LQVSQSILERFPHPVVCASFCRRFRPKTHELGLLAAHHLSNLYRNGGTWEYQNQSTGISNFQTSHFLDAENVLVPNDEVLHAFSRFAQSILAKTTSNEAMTLAKLRDKLLPKLISGELHIADAERILGERK
jgi:type I restriction enzyme S subunit